METSQMDELCFPQLFNNSCRKPTPAQSDVLLAYILQSFIALITAALNLLVIISISHFRQLHTPTNLLILSLAVSDFLVGLILMPVTILLTEACWYFGDLTCALYNIVNFIITSSTVGNMVLISIDRYFAIFDPLHYTIRVTLNRTKICICLCWICSVIYNCLILKYFLRQPDSQNSCHGECVIVIDNITGAVDLVVTFIAPITVIIVLYIRVFVVAVSQARAMRSHVIAVTMQRSVGATAKKSEMKAARTLGVVVLVFLICFFPYYTPSLIGEDIENSSSTSLIVIWLLYFNSCLNPLIYASLYPWFRKSIKLIVTLKILQSYSCDSKIL
ncbi:trace amine-associated receptor 8a-like [Gymnodraco acuticeps]|uniref:Trace amine-associated receptor 8a-like n=1 Tax=Gymnodraco acuticeps TaxID=8218 RepID=A0A6P8U5Z4_GYMAC|nr:trace amine-associated receptor 8a-like [Gymnodraco acuticeps]XP_034072233.1 trace amine-associated receptor 8a-like [Gymnodraco acuticeps]